VRRESLESLACADAYSRKFAHYSFAIRCHIDREEIGEEVVARYQINELGGLRLIELAALDLGSIVRPTLNTASVVVTAKFGSQWAKQALGSGPRGFHLLDLELRGPYKDIQKRESTNDRWDRQDTSTIGVMALPFQQ
jgi:hypothetical protein